MIENELDNEAQIRRFLLGEMSAAERSAFEEKFIADEDFFEQIRVVEDELIESYVRGTLLPSEKAKFERNFQTTEQRRRRVEFTRSMLAKLNDQNEIAVIKKAETATISPSVWELITNFFKTPALAFGAISAIVILGGWLLLKNFNSPEIVRQITPTPTPIAETVQTNSNQPVLTEQNTQPNLNLKTPLLEKNAADSEQKKEPPKNNSNTRKEKEIVVNPVLALFAGTVRSEGKTGEVSLSKNAGFVRLQLNLESADYKIYRAEIVNADGDVIGRANGLKAKNSKINFPVSAAKLQKGDYIVKLSALNGQNEIESVADYTFRVNRK